MGLVGTTLHFGDHNLYPLLWTIYSQWPLVATYIVSCNRGELRRMGKLGNKLPLPPRSTSTSLPPSIHHNTSSSAVRRTP